MSAIAGKSRATFSGGIDQIPAVKGCVYDKPLVSRIRRDGMM